MCNCLEDRVHSVLKRPDNRPLGRRRAQHDGRLLLTDRAELGKTHPPRKDLRGIIMRIGCDRLGGEMEFHIIATETAVLQ